MADREKVIWGLECCTGIHEHCNECPYNVGISFCHIALKNDILDLLKASGWISVKDRLPEIGAKCLVYADGKMTVAKHIANNDWITGVWFPVPTYWMPLPEPPKEGKV